MGDNEDDLSFFFWPDSSWEDHCGEHPDFKLFLDGVNGGIKMKLNEALFWIVVLILCLALCSWFGQTGFAGTIQPDGTVTLLGDTWTVPGMQVEEPLVDTVVMDLTLVVTGSVCEWTDNIQSVTLTDGVLELVTVSLSLGVSQYGCLAGCDVRKFVMVNTQRQRHRHQFEHAIR